MRDQAVHALIGGLEAKLLGTCQTFGRRVDPHHPHRLEHVSPQELVEKIGAASARADDCAFDFGHFAASLTACSSRSANELGRASCRERVCQYGLISVGAVDLQKKKKERTWNK